MKKFLLLNILFCLGLVTVTKQTVESALSTHIKIIRISNSVLPTSLPNHSINSEDLSELELSESDFYPVDEEVQEIKETAIENYQYDAVKKEVNLNKIEQKLVVGKAIINEGSLSEIELTLSFDELNEPVLKNVASIKKIAWSQNFKPVKIAETVVAKFQKPVLKTKKEVYKKPNLDKLSFQQAAVEKTVNIQVTEDPMFFDYSKNDEEVKKIEPIIEKEEIIVENFEVSKPLEAISEKNGFEQAEEIIENKESIVESNEQIVEKKTISITRNEIDNLIEESINEIEKKLEEGITSESKDTPVVSSATSSIVSSVVNTVASSVIKTEKSISQNNLKAEKTVKRSPAIPETQPEEKLNIEEDNISSFVEKEKTYGCNENVSNPTKIKNSKLNIMASSFNYEKPLTQVFDYEIRMEDDIDESYNADSNGSVSLNFKLNSEYATRRLSFYHRDYKVMTTEVKLGTNRKNTIIPLVETYTFNKIIEDYNITTDSHILMKLSKEMEDIELGEQTNYNHKLYLDRRFQIVDRNDSDYSYILFLGVTDGNIVVNYRDSLNNIITKVIHLSADTIFYDEGKMTIQKRDYVSFFEETTLSSCKSIIDIEKSDINLFNTKGKINKESLNQFSFHNIIYPSNTRKYYELSHLGESIYIGRWNHSNIVIPNEGYFENIIYEAGLEVSESSCLSQINLSKSATELYVNGLSSEGMRLDSRILDKDGIFYNDLGENSHKVFFKGDAMGVINIKVKYVDGSYDFLQTYCSDSTYIIEQL